MSKKKETIIVHVNQLDALLALTPEDMQTIVSAMRKYAFGNESVDIPEHLQFGWIFFKQAIDYDCKRYAAACSARQEAGRKGGIASQAKQANQAKEAKQANNNNNNNNKHSNNNNNTPSDETREAVIVLEKEQFYSAVDEIVKSYPSCRPAQRDKTISAVAEKLAEDQDRPVPEILDEIVAGVKAYASAVETWEEKRFVSDPVKFIREGTYKCDPAVWVRKPPHSPAKNGFNPMDPATWNRPE